MHREKVPKVFGICSDCGTKCKYTNNYRDYKTFINKSIVMAKKVKVIVIPRGKADTICKALGIGRTTLYAALNYTSHSEDAKLTRQKVLKEYGGIETTKVVF